jgi:hypothetical protein
MGLYLALCPSSAPLSRVHAFTPWPSSSVLLLRVLPSAEQQDLQGSHRSLGLTIYLTASYRIYMA